MDMDMDMGAGAGAGDLRLSSTVSVPPDPNTAMLRYPSISKDIAKDLRLSSTVLILHTPGYVEIPKDIPKDLRLSSTVCGRLWSLESGVDLWSSEFRVQSLVNIASRRIDATRGSVNGSGSGSGRGSDFRMDLGFWDWGFWDWIWRERFGFGCGERDTVDNNRVATTTDCVDEQTSRRQTVDGSDRVVDE
ncbi:hypothetical protein PLEOSDRAFT_172018 [Pleurotus ostreatus PC15]|uniref:Uncharacterized protein n=1 Tax=Pleurotus ostreatus (strain PC15) TaxID=1137138 RepID=A0A067NG16_PLEO1|nr:hypothetical protein PLEOSDRAFT_172018 [Pleurotus ostreatus PC15]